MKPLIVIIFTLFSLSTHAAYEEYEGKYVGTTPSGVDCSFSINLDGFVKIGFGYGDKGIGLVFKYDEYEDAMESAFSSGSFAFFHESVDFSGGKLRLYFVEDKKIHKAKMLVYDVIPVGLYTTCEDIEKVNN